MADILCRDIVKIGDFRSFGRVEVTTSDRKKWSVSSDDLINVLIGNLRIDARSRRKNTSKELKLPRKRAVKPKAKPKVMRSKFNITSEDT